ncbi:MAG: hypothetical protein ABWU16_03920 [Halothiobacillaceae bacterium]
MLAYLVGSDVLRHREVKKLKAHIDRVINELPETLLHQINSKIKALSTPPASTQSVLEVKPQALDAIEQRMSAIDHKLELILQHMQSPTVAPQPQPAPPPAAVQSAPATYPPREAASPDAPPRQAAPSATPVAQPMPSAAAPTQAPTTAAAPSAAELEFMRELLLELIKIIPSSKTEETTKVHHGDRSQTAPPSSAAPSRAEASHKPSIDELRSELDKLTRELNLELGRRS